MSRSPQVNLSSAIKRSLLTLSAVFLVLSAFGGNVLAVPIAIDMYQDMETGNAGDTLTTTMMNSTAHPSSGWATTVGTVFWVATNYHRDLPGPVIVGGTTTYNGTGGSRCWKFQNNNAMNYVMFTGSGHSNVTVACYYTTLTTLSHQVGYDSAIMWGSSFACMQTLAGQDYGAGSTPVFRQHSGAGGQSTAALATLGGANAFDSVATGKTYWISMKYDGSTAQTFYAVFDPDNSYSQVGSTLLCQSIYNDTSMGWKNFFGRGDNHGNQSNDLTYSYFDQIMFDWSNGAFPLLPSGANDATAPSAPAVVRDGTGAADLSIALSSTQLSANWDMAWDAQSGIKAYQYAIGTSQGGTNVVNWTTIKNQLGVTAAGLSLTTGQTYYFSVKAINGVGLTGSATNSNGQTVGTDASAPGAPAAVRDAGWAYNYMPDIDSWNDSHDLYGNFDPAVDNESGISFYQFGVGTTPGATDAWGWSTLPANAVNAWATNTNFTPGQRYYFTVRAVNNAGITGPAANSNGVTIAGGTDTTPPSAPGSVRDGTGTDISTTSSTTQLSANWDASSDSQSGISGYQYAIGTSAGGSQTVNWTSLGNITTVTKAGLTLTVGQTYFFSVKAVNSAGLVGSPTNSNGQTVVAAADTTPPSAPANVRDGTGTDISTTSSTTQLSANWDAATDSQSGISGYQYAIGTSAGGTQTVNWTSLGNVTTVTKTGLTLSVGQTYYFSVKAVNGAGLTGSATNSNGQTVVSVGNTVYFSDNFESWTVHGGAWSSVNGESSTHTLDTSTDYAKAGAKSLKITDSDTTATTGASLTKNFSPVISTDIYVRFFIFLPTGFGSANSTCTRRVLRVFTDTSNYTVLTLVGDGLSVSEVGGWSGTGTTAISENAWHCVELHVAPPSASTAIQYWVDGTSAGTLTGAFSGSSTFNYIQFGDVLLGSGTTNSTGTIYWDELVVSNYYNGTSAATTYFSDNFENWTVHGGAWSSVSGETATQTQNTSTDYARAGTKSLKLTDSDTTNSYGACLVKNFSPTIASGIYVRFYLYLPSAYVSANNGAAWRRMLRVFCNPNRGQLSFYDATPLMEEIGGWTASLASSAVSADAWHCIEMYMATPSASTAMQYWVDGTSTGTLTGAFSGSTSYDRIEFGDVSVGSGTNVTGTFYLDELVVSDSYNGLLP